MTLSLLIPVLVIGSIASLATPGPGDAPFDRSARVAQILGELPSADSVLVERQEPAPRPGRPRLAPTGEPRRPRSAGERRDLPRRTVSKEETSVEIGRPGAEWMARFAKVLEHGGVDRDRPCAPSWMPNDTTPRLGVSVKAHHQGRIRHFQIRFEQRCALISDKPFGASLDISSVAQSLLDLVREALPRDSLLRSAALPPHISAAPASRETSIVVTRPTEDRLPESGEYVYVEELPEAVEKPQPVRPEAAAGAHGTVLVQALVGKDGLVKDVRVVKSIPELDAAAVECVRAWRFKPALSRGAPVEVWVAVPVRFSPP